MKIIMTILAVTSVASIMVATIRLCMGQGLRAMYIALVIIGIFDLVLIYVLYRKYTWEQFKEIDFEIDVITDTHFCGYCNQEREVHLEGGHRIVFYQDSSGKTHDRTIPIKLAYCDTCNFYVQVNKLADKTNADINRTYAELEKKYKTKGESTTK